jgi:hypothetical protein
LSIAAGWDLIAREFLRISFLTWKWTLVTHELTHNLLLFIHLSCCLCTNIFAQSNGFFFDVLWMFVFLLLLKKEEEFLFIYICDVTDFVTFFLYIWKNERMALLNCEGDPLLFAHLFLHVMVRDCTVHFLYRCVWIGPIGH